MQQHSGEKPKLNLILTALIADTTTCPTHMANTDSVRSPNTNHKIIFVCKITLRKGWVRFEKVESMIQRHGPIDTKILQISLNDISLIQTKLFGPDITDDISYYE